MKKLILILIVLLFFNNTGISQSFPFLGSFFKSQNFQCGGFVTAVYPAGNPTNLESQILYAKTDVGGVYKSINNGNTWTSISSYFNGTAGNTENMFYSEYIIAGLAVNPMNPDNVVIAWGSLETDAVSAEHRCLWVTQDGGNTWSKSSFTNPDFSNRGPWFQGDNFMRKVGGECITFDPLTSNRVFVGGNPPSGFSQPNPSKLFKSDDGGLTFTVLHSFPSDDSILCVSIHKTIGRMWIGTSRRIYYSERDINGNYTAFYENSPPANLGCQYFIRILPRRNGDAFVAFATYLIPPAKQGGLLKFNQSTGWENYTTDFDGTLGYEYSDKNYLSMLTFADVVPNVNVDENVLIAGRVFQPVRKSIVPVGGTNLGQVWSGESTINSNQIDLTYLQNNPQYPYPKHQSLYEYGQRMFSGLNFMIKNPNHPTCWYISGGAGLRMTTNAGTNYSGDFLGGNTNTRWYYSVTNQNMPVIYDVAFEPLPNSMNPGTLIPMADWTLAYKKGNQNSNDFTALDYDSRNIMGTNAGGCWISNVSRALIRPDITGTSYAVGGDLYSGNYYACMYKREIINSTTVNISRIQTPPNSHPVFKTRERNICDALLYNNNGVSSHIILVGAIYGPQNPNNENLGVFYSTNEGSTWTFSFFNGTSLQSGINTQQQYDNSLIPGLYPIPGAVPEMFAQQFNFAKVPAQTRSGTDLIYLYLENGGVFVSTNGGYFFSSAGNPPNPPVTYLDKGCLKYIGNNKLVLAIQNKGLFIGYINTLPGVNYGKVNWESTSFGNFTSASQVDVYNDKWVVFGKRGTDVNDRLFRRSNLYDWNLISGRIRGVRSLRIRPNNTNEVWISTTGMGVVVYNRLTSNWQPIIAWDNININTTFDEDVVVENGGHLILRDSAVIQMAENVKIKVMEGGKITANNVTFISKGDNEYWGGIEIENASDSTIIANCTFNNAVLPVKVTNDAEYSTNKIFITNNMFNCQNNSEYALYCYNVSAMKIDSNTFNLSSSSENATGIYIKNDFTYQTEGSYSYIHVTNNKINNGFSTIILSNYVSEITPYYIYNNTITGNSVRYGIIARFLTGAIKNNKFYTFNANNPVYLYQSNPDIANNIIHSTGTSIVLDGHSAVNLAPLSDASSVYWYGGKNKLYSSAGSNIILNNSGMPNTNIGHNIFSTSGDPDDFNVTGIMDSSHNSFSSRYNLWSPNSIPNNFLWTEYNPALLTNFEPSVDSGAITSVSYSGVQLINVGFGVQDTLKISANIYNQSNENEDILYQQANLYFHQYHYPDAINNYKYIIDNFGSFGKLSGCQYELFDCYDALDTGESQTYKDNLFSDLKNYLTAKKQTEHYSDEFNDIANYLIAMCEARMANYNEALTIFEFMAMYHPDASTRLLASWDFTEIQGLLGSGGGENNLSEKEIMQRERKRMENLISKDSTYRKLKLKYDKANKEIEEYYNNKYSSKTNNGQNKTKVNQTGKGSKYNNPNLTKADRDKILNRAERVLSGAGKITDEEKIKQQRTDFLMLAGYKSGKDNEITVSNIPTQYELYQNYPNPFNPNTKITFDLPKNGNVRLVIYDILGREIKTMLNNEFKQAGKYTIEFEGSSLASGIYFYRIITGDFIATKRMVLIK